MEFELSFKNPVVRVWVIIMALSFILATLLIFLTDIPRTYISLSQSIGSWAIFIAWFLFHKRRKKLAEG
ncbi:hypothetical protein AB1K89_13130 [Sporosarcina sp. 179-K 8C2 HS]|uniref:hypothetical protein n=1 Tax=Sporosarcina sp. 179-K 8C2 HS TaxID=3142387 RepID=UPI0039A38D6B